MQFSGDFRSLETPPPPDDMPYTVGLGSRQDDYILYWDYDNTTITFEVHVRTTGWVGFGLSAARNMLGADIVIGWVDDSGEAHLHVSTNFWQLSNQRMADGTSLGHNGSYTTWVPSYIWEKGEGGNNNYIYSLTSLGMAHAFCNGSMVGTHTRSKCLFIFIITA